jgi:two-component sensor histidine kinase
MGTAQDLILSSQFQGTDLRTLINKTLEPIVPPGPKRLQVEGSEFFLPTEIATPLALVIHELATNSLKYGSWSNDTGKTAVHWTLQHDDASATNLILTWQETGGPAVKAPERTGFGTQLIERTLPESTVERTFTGSGLTCTMTLHIRNLNTLKNGIRPRQEEGDTFAFSR